MNFIIRINDKGVNIMKEISPIQKLRLVSSEKKNYPKKEDKIDLMIRLPLEYGSEIVQARVWSEDTINYHYYFSKEVDGKKKTFIGLERKRRPNMHQLYDEYKKLKYPARDIKL